MAQIIFKNPLVGIVKLVDGAIPANAVWTELTNAQIVNDSAKITPTLGSYEGYTNADGDDVAGFTSKTKYLAEVKTFKPIEGVVDVDGLISDEYAFRITEGKTNSGYILERCQVQCGTGTDGGENTLYQFNALKPAEGNTLKPYPLPTEG